MAIRIMITDDHSMIREGLKNLLELEGDIEVVAEAENGAFALLPKHTDFVTALLPSVLILTDKQGHELFFGVDQGVLVKQDYQVDIAVRRAVQGEDLARLHDTVQASFVEVDEQERVARTALSKLEAGIVRRFSDLRKPLI